jgi:hypothetical protein
MLKSSALPLRTEIAHVEGTSDEQTNTSTSTVSLGVRAEAPRLQAYNLPLAHREGSSSVGSSGIGCLGSRAGELSCRSPSSFSAVMSSSTAVPE